MTEMSSKELLAFNKGRFTEREMLIPLHKKEIKNIIKEIEKHRFFDHILNEPAYHLTREDLHEIKENYV